MEQEIVERLIDLVEQASEALWAAASKAVIADIVTDGIMAMILIALAVTLFGFAIWLLRHRNDLERNTDGDFELGATVFAGTGCLVLLFAATTVDCVIRALLAPEYVAIEKLMELIP